MRKLNRLPIDRLALATGALLISICAASDVKNSQSDIKAADSFQHKLDHVVENAKQNPPDTRPTTFSQDEINAYFAQRRLKLPEGVKTVRFDLAPAAVNAHSTVDFSQIRQGHPTSNPLLAIFDGVHDADVTAHTESSGNGRVRVQVESVALDGVSVPPFILKLFIQKFVNPKYPSISLDSEYNLPAKIDRAEIGAKQGTVIQK